MNAPTPRVRRVDPADEDSLAAWYRVLRRALDEGHGGGEPVLPLADLREAMAAEGQALACVSLAGDGSPAGALLVECDEEDPDTAEVDIAVLPGARRRGHGSALLRAAEEIGAGLGRSVQVAEVSAAPGQDLAAGPGGGFALAHGFEAAQAEDLYVMDLPLSGAVEAVLRVRTRPEEGDPEVTGWQDVCPEELVASCARLRRALEEGSGGDPLEDLVDGPGQAAAAEPADIGGYTDLVRRSEAWRAEKGVRSLVSVALDGAGTAVGLSELVLMPDTDAADQAGTLVLPEHRGRGLGSRMWLRNLTELARDFPERRRVRTWAHSEDTVTREIATNLGFRPVERTFSLERALPVR